jgi:hypothetical protein
MAKVDPHPAIRHCANLDGHPQHADIDHNSFVVHQQCKAVVSPPSHRMDALNQLDAQISLDTSSLRQRSQLVDLRRRLSHTHEYLLRHGK